MSSEKLSDKDDTSSQFRNWYLGIYMHCRDISILLFETKINSYQYVLPHIKITHLTALLNVV